jgi:hypothetical protein
MMQNLTFSPAPLLQDFRLVDMHHAPKVHAGVILSRIPAFVKLARGCFYQIKTPS